MCNNGMPSFFCKVVGAVGADIKSVVRKQHFYTKVLRVRNTFVYIAGPTRVSSGRPGRIKNQPCQKWCLAIDGKAGVVSLRPFPGVSYEGYDPFT